jgi:hypothetical protein
VGDDVTPGRYESEKRQYIDGLQKSARIVWHDETLKSLYEKQVDQMHNQ